MKLLSSTTKILKNCKKQFLILLISLLFSCNTDQRPGWILNPPNDTDEYIYLVSISENEEFIPDMISQLKNRYGYDNEYIPNIIMSEVFKDDGNVVVKDTFSDETGFYKLIQIKKSFLDPLVDLFVYRFEKISSMKSDNEVTADEYLENGKTYSAYSSYLSALRDLLMSDDLEDIPAKIRLFNNLAEIVKPIKISDVSSFDKVYIGESKLSEVDRGNREISFSLTGTPGLDYTGFKLITSFQEGYNLRDRVTLIPIVENSYSFTPPAPKQSGEHGIAINMDFEELLQLFDVPARNSYISGYIRPIKNYLESIMENTQLDLTYSAITSLKLMSKLVAVNPSITGEGITRRLLEDGASVQLAPFFKYDESLEYYIRELDFITNGMFDYLVFAENFSENRYIFEDDLLLELSGEFRVLEIDTLHTVLTRSIKTEFIIEDGEEQIAYLDLGLKIGEILSGLEF